jgi:ribosomal protein S18 acetylase RimI-like enzyme
MKVRDLEWDDFSDIVGNYFSYYDELPGNPALGLTLFAEKPTLAEESEWFGRLYAQTLTGMQLASVAEENGRVVGLAQVAQKQPHHDQAHVGVLGIALHKDFRGKGVGTQLMRHVLERCRGRFEVVELTVFSTNEPAKKLYRKMGFRYVGTLPKSVKRGDRYFDEDLMVLEL